MQVQAGERPGAKEAAVITKAAVNAADRLGLSARTLAAVIGVSEATVSRMKRQDLSLERGSKSFELAILLVRLALGAAPVEKIISISGLTDVLAYLDARRALV
jgi:hypothetical protein